MPSKVNVSLCVLEHIQTRGGMVFRLFLILTPDGVERSASGVGQ